MNFIYNNKEEIQYLRSQIIHKDQEITIQKHDMYNLIAKMENFSKQQQELVNLYLLIK
jgi:hypothetical protein